MGNTIDYANAVDPGMTVQQVALVVLIIGLACFITARWVIWRITRDIQDPPEYFKLEYDPQLRRMVRVPKTDAEIKADRKARRYRARYGAEPPQYRGHVTIPAVSLSDTDDIDETTALIARDMMDEDDNEFYRRTYG